MSQLRSEAWDSDVCDVLLLTSESASGLSYPWKVKWFFCVHIRRKNLSTYWPVLLDCSLILRTRTFKAWGRFTVWVLECFSRQCRLLHASASALASFCFALVWTPLHVLPITLSFVSAPLINLQLFSRWVGFVRSGLECAQTDWGACDVLLLSLDVKIFLLVYYILGMRSGCRLCTQEGSFLLTGPPGLQLRFTQGLRRTFIAWSRLTVWVLEAV